MRIDQFDRANNVNQLFKPNMLLIFPFCVHLFAATQRSMPFVGGLRSLCALSVLCGVRFRAAEREFGTIHSTQIHPLSTLFKDVFNLVCHPFCLPLGAKHVKNMNNIRKSICTTF